MVFSADCEIPPFIPQTHRTGAPELTSSAPISTRANVVAVCLILRAPSALILIEIAEHFLSPELRDWNPPAKALS
jgi:hypothetical protein